MVLLTALGAAWCSWAPYLLYELMGVVELPAWFRRRTLTFEPRAPHMTAQKTGTSVAAHWRDLCGQQPWLISNRSPRPRQGAGCSIHVSLLISKRRHRIHSGR